MLKSALTEAHKIRRVNHCVTHLNLPSSSFIDFSNLVHVDEKWFHMDKVKRTVFLSHEEADSHRAVKNKSHVRKVMFLCAVAQPSYDSHRNCPFDGKLGIWPFVEYQQAQRSSMYHQRGDILIEPLSVDRDVYREWMIGKVLPAVANRMPQRIQKILIQQDNAPSHILPDDPLWVQAIRETGREIVLGNQPAQSPDLNVLDLGFLISSKCLHTR